MTTEPITILLIEDNPGDARIIKEMLIAGAARLRLEWVDRLSKGQERLAQGRVDLVLLDLSLPDSRGIETFTQLGAQVDQVPIVVLSGIDDEVVAIEAVREGAQDYLVKGQVDSNLLIRAIRYAIERHRMQSQLQQYAGHLEQMVSDKLRELERERARTIQAAKLAALGEMATGVAHELNQPLTAMLFEADYLKMLAEKKREQEAEGKVYPIEQELDEVAANLTSDIGRCRKIIDHLRTFGRISEGQAVPLDLNRPLQDSFILIGERMRQRNVVVQQELTPNLPPILGEPNRLEQVFLNLLSNAEYAMQEMEQRVCSGEVDRPGYQKTLRVSTSVEDGWVVTVVEDNGCGIDEAHQEHLFEPFFTTKPVGEGTGLGLSISYGIVAEFGGEITYRSKRNEGTAFILRFPIHRE